MVLVARLTAKPARAVLITQTDVNGSKLVLQDKFSILSRMFHSITNNKYDRFHSQVHDAMKWHLMVPGWSWAGDEGHSASRRGWCNVIRYICCSGREQTKNYEPTARALQY